MANLRSLTLLQPRLRRLLVARTVPLRPSPARMQPMDAPTRRSWQIQPTPGFVDWLAECDLSLLITTYQIGKLLMVGRGADGKLSVCDQTFPRAMGVWSDGQTIWLATAHQVWRLEHQFDGKLRRKGFDRLFVPRVAYTTGDLDLHDIAVDGGGQPVFVATLFNSLATVAIDKSFIPLWRPPFIDDLTSQDRCHLNGVAMVDGNPRYVTLCAPSNERKGWKQRRQDGGCVLEVESGQVVASDLSMPHSPRWRDDRLWLLNSGKGYLGFLDPHTLRFEPVAFCPGYARGLAFCGHYAVVGLSRPREQNRFGGLGLDDELARHGRQAMTGVQVVDLRTGNVEHALEIAGRIAELYDVALLKGVRRPTALGLENGPLRANVWATGNGRGRHWRGKTRGK
jgi:uncharacterized protein (TIGR03032 family)